MKKPLVLFVFVFIVLLQQAYGQNAFRYQAVLKNNSGDVLAGDNVTFLISILTSESSSDRVYSEFHRTTTDQFGHVYLNIGEGTVTFGEFDEIQWGQGDYYLKVDMDEGGATNFKEFGTTRLLSVPYALHALSSEENQTLQLSNNLLSITGDDKGDEVSLTKYLDNTDNQTLSLAGNVLTIEGGNSVELPENGIIPSPSQPVPLIFQGTRLYVYPEDIGVETSWGKNGTLVGAASLENGQENTDLIVNSLSATDDGMLYAARVCNELEEFGFSDWYLPARLELDAIYKQSYLLTGLSVGEYWSSTEGNNGVSWAQDIVTGGQGQTNKQSGLRCRCVRKDN